MTQLLYFAWVREKLGRDGEEIALPVSIATVGELLDWLASRSPAHAAALADRSRLRVAVNQEFADDYTPVGPADEVAIFPPVTGG
ncbi:molybdopterin converting factor subunit 1 [Polymorphobacter arshaanensis]|uniref:Molybdopterin synthase sulfur carrier subunit n=1 Tax=Glacieibacterium arshaanense TaxID=2511025 RepID=A0A4Y9EU97_9SPHN|nr:molybdopterin converting factor subunit 1 [Polymorphobacter arshaanensis]TFU06478.1 molybdopterin converting factor subunit 1 [Polymorphobacter arshaanensis]